MLVYALTIFTGAFLLFQVQPLIGKYILPWFGGGPGVWTTCLLFFQVLLLGGYAYAHFTSRWLKPRSQAICHLILLIAALTWLPITPADTWKPDGTGNPTWQILGLLTMSLGLPYFVLSATGPLMQQWFSRTHPGASPYRLYALSNVGSLLALVSFPIYFETQFTRKTQAMLWAWGLVLYAVGCGGCAIKLWQAEKSLNAKAQPPEIERANQKPEAGIPESHSQPHKEARLPQSLTYSTLDKFLWLLLPACASVLLLATTNMMCQEVAVIPFLWVLPLALYLLSFIICFDSPRWYARIPFALALTAAWGGIGWALFNAAEASVYLQLGIYSVGLFICCMVCHGELYRLKPDPQHLTGFYVMIAAGGALGGIFVAVAAPLIFTSYFELHWGLLFSGLLLLLVCLRDQNRASLNRWRLLTCAWLLTGLLALGIALWFQAHKLEDMMVYRSRNFYGVLSVYELHKNEAKLHQLQLTHGRTLHGLQLTDAAQAAWPTTYYGEKSGVGLAEQALPTGSRRIGVIGLGAGTLAAYARTGDNLRFYEINPEVCRLAGSWFTYLKNCAGKVEIIHGDARLSLEREAPQNFDLLVLDAFNSDSIPVHLLTKEAFAIYRRHLKSKGIIAVHVSNRSLNLEPVVVKLARFFDYKVVTIDSVAPRDKPWIRDAVWMLLSHDEDIIGSPTIRLAARTSETDPAGIPLWTDDFASLFQILRSEKGPQIDPAFSKAQIQVATSLCQQGDFAGAIASYHLALQTHPDLPELLNNLAWLLATCPDAHLRDGAQAVQYAEHACELTHYRVTPMVGSLAAAYAEAGRFDAAMATAEKACALAEKSGEAGLLQRNQELLLLYRKHQPYHEPASPDPAEPPANHAASGNAEKLVPATP
jgi:tetratricopeptide (TPR) repeat protein